MDISAPTPQPEKRKRGRPSQKDATAALNLIKEVEKVTDDSETKKAEEQAEYEKQLAFAELEKAKIEEAQQKIKRVLRENLKKKEEQEKLKNNKAFLETSSGKIKWVSRSSGSVISGYYKDKLIFEIKRGFTIFNLYVKNKDFMKDKNMKVSYLTCSTDIQKLKKQSEKLI